MRLEGTVPVKEVLVLRTAAHVSDEMIAKVKEQSGVALVIVLPPGDELESLDEELMRQHGWVKTDAGA